MAVVLLPVPLDEGAAGLELGRARRWRGEKAKSATPVAQTRLILYDKDRPVQKLTVDKKYVNPPASQLARIKNDREKVRQALTQPLPERLWTLPFARPVPGGVSCLFGMKRVFNRPAAARASRLDSRGLRVRPFRPAPTVRWFWWTICIFPAMVYINHG